MTTTPDYEGLCEKLVSEAAEMRAAVNGEKIGENFHCLNWSDKPHRVLYDACGFMEESAQAIRTLMGEKAGLRADLTFIAGFAQMRSTDDSRIFARVCRGALRNIAERAKSALTGRGAGE